MSGYLSRIRCFKNYLPCCYPVARDMVESRIEGFHVTSKRPCWITTSKYRRWADRIINVIIFRINIQLPTGEYNFYRIMNVIILRINIYLSTGEYNYRIINGIIFRIKIYLPTGEYVKPLYCFCSSREILYLLPSPTEVWVPRGQNSHIKEDKVACGWGWTGIILPPACFFFFLVQCFTICK